MSNQIAVFFDHQYRWKEAINILDFLHEDIHQGKAASETTTFGWAWPVKPLVQSVCRSLSLLFACGQLCFLSRQVAGFFDQQYYWKEPICIVDFFLDGDNHHWKVTSETTTSWLGVTKGSRIL